MYNELIGYSSESLDPDLAKTLINRAYREILEQRSWSFLVAEGVLTAPEQVTAGTVAVLRFSTQVTCDATAKAALNALTLDIPLGTRQFRLGGAISRIYNIDSYNSTTGVITLKEPYTEVTNASASYVVFKCYYLPPLVNNQVDFLRFISVVDLVNGRKLQLGVKKQELDRRDPQRSCSTIPVLISNYKADSSGNPLFELWPHPLSAQSYVCLFSRKGAILSDDEDVVPWPLTEELVLTRAQYHLAKWAEFNKGANPLLRAQDWRFLMSDSSARYEKLLLSCKKQDDEVLTSNVFDTHKYWGPPSASWLQQHDYP